jgi:carboxymethylenebutenolidase
MKQDSKFLTNEGSHGVMDIYVAVPEVPEKASVVIVLMEAFGVNDHIKAVCERLSEHGFVAAAPDLYHREGRRIVVDYADRKSIMPLMGKLTNQGIIQDVRSTINFLEDLPHINTQNVSTLGFCIGGYASVLCATKLNLKKMVSFYGAGIIHPREGFALTPIITDLGHIKSKCLFFFGGADASISGDEVKEIEMKLSAKKVPFEVNIFENANHGFFCDERKSYDKEAASASWNKTLAFLKD